MFGAFFKAPAVFCRRDMRSEASSRLKTGRFGADLEAKPVHVPNGSTTSMEEPTWLTTQTITRGWGTKVLSLRLFFSQCLSRDSFGSEPMRRLHPMEPQGLTQRPAFKLRRSLRLCPQTKTASHRISFGSVRESAAFLLFSSQFSSLGKGRSC